MAVHSSKITAQYISTALKKADINQIVISPGSRNAPLIIELTNQLEFTNYSVVDERSAGFFALGLAQQTGKPAVLVCTSGSALLNYYPAIAEAFYSHIPLIVLSADRPQKWIDQGEGQTIRQHNVFKNHSWYNVTLSESGNDTDIINIKEAIEIAIDKRGPVHINLPFDEPLYETVKDIIIDFEKITTDFPDKIYDESFLSGFEKKWQAAKKKMILVGQHHKSEFLQLQLNKFLQVPSVIILTENISNVYNDKFINNIDQVIFSLNDEVLSGLKPDILITVGRNIVSKKVKQFLRKHSPTEHWHIEKTDLPPDTFEVLTQHFNTAPEMFFSQFLFLVKPTPNSIYQQNWLQLKQKHKLRHKAFISKTGFSDLKVYDFISSLVPDNYMIQWANSSVIRYAQLYDYKPSISHFANRGTSGIDGGSSTAVGAAVVSESPVVLVTGDISFLYDSNALWNKYIPKNFKIILVNNGGGDIFNFIPGPSNTKAIDNFFVTKHRYNAKHLSEMFNLSYYLASNLTELQESIKQFFLIQDKPAILEINTRDIDNAGVLKAYFNYLK